MSVLKQLLENRVAVDAALIQKALEQSFGV
jgi:hypothetical protein